MNAAVRRATALLILSSGVAAADLTGPSPEQQNAQVDFNGDRLLDYDEIIFALQRKTTGGGDIIGYQKARQAPKAPAVDQLATVVRDMWLDITDVAQPVSASLPPKFRLDAINPKKLGLTKMIVAAPEEKVTRHERFDKAFNFKVRRSADVLGNDLEDPYEQGALFSYAHDFNVGEDQWAARGVISFERTITENPRYVGPSGDPEGPASGDPVADPERRGHTFFLRAAAHQLNIGFDKVTTGGSDRDELDTLDFFYTARLLWHLPDRNPTGIIGLRSDLSIHYATDFAAEKGVVAATLDLAPQTRLPGHGVFKDIGHYLDRFGDTNAVLRFRWSVAAHFEAGTVEEAGSETSLAGYDDFARIGGKAGLELLICPDRLENRLTLNTTYTHYEALRSRVPSTHLFSAALQYVFPVGSGLFVKADKVDGEILTMTERDMLWTLRLEYTNGTTPLIGEDDNHVLAGLGVAF